VFVVFAADMNRQPNKRRKRKPASSSGAGAGALGGSAMGGRIKRSPDPQNFTPILGVCLFPIYVTITVCYFCLQFVPFGA